MSSEKWRPIETAPKDGREFLAASNNVLTRSGTPCMYHAAFTSGDPCPESACDGEPLWDVTHWMPLPSHPEAPRPEMWDVRDGQGDLYARQPLEKAASIVMQHPDQDLRLSPAPRPEASAPDTSVVGVEELVERMRHAPSRLWMADLVGQQISVERMRDILAFALARSSNARESGSVQAQPAADFDAWQKNPYTKVLMKSVAEDYVPKHGQQPAACDGTCYRSPSGLCETHEAEAHAYLAGQSLKNESDQEQQGGES